MTYLLIICVIAILISGFLAGGLLVVLISDGISGVSLGLLMDITRYQLGDAIVSGPFGYTALADLVAKLVALGTENVTYQIQSTKIELLSSGVVFGGAIFGFCIVGGLTTYLIRLFSRNAKAEVKRKEKGKEQDSEKLQKQIIKDSSLINYGGTDVARGVENVGNFMFGAPGSGKTQKLRKFLLKAIERGQLGLCLDINEEHMPSLYRPKLDIVIGAYDPDSAPWSPLAEIRGPQDCQRVADSMIPIKEGSSSAEWDEYARTLTGGILSGFEKLNRQGYKITNFDLCVILANKNLEILKSFLGEDHPALAFLGSDGINSQMVDNVFGIAASKARALRSLPPEAGFLSGHDDRKSFSIERWVEENADKKKSPFLFVPVPKRMKTEATGIASMVAGFYADAVLSLSENDVNQSVDKHRRCWFICDELGQYPAVSGLADFLSLSRKYGGAAVCASQSISQLIAAYGQTGADILLANFGNYSIFRCGDPVTAKWGEEQIGKRRKKRSMENSSTSYGSNNSSTSTSTSNSITIESLVLASSLQRLVPLRCWDFRVDTLEWVQIERVPFSPLPAATMKRSSKTTSKVYSAPSIITRLNLDSVPESAPDIFDAAEGEGENSGALAQGRDEPGEPTVKPRNGRKSDDGDSGEASQGELQEERQSEKGASESLLGDLEDYL